MKKLINSRYIDNLIRWIWYDWKELSSCNILISVDKISECCQLSDFLRALNSILKSQLSWFHIFIIPKILLSILGIWIVSSTSALEILT